MNPNMKPNQAQKNRSPADKSRPDNSSAKSGNSTLWILLGGGAVLFCLLPICVGGIVAGVYWIKPAPNDPGAADVKKPDDEPKNQKPAVIADRIRFNADLAKAGDDRRIERIFLSRNGKRLALS